MEKQSEKRIRVEALAERIKLLFGFCADLIADIDLIEEVAKKAPERADMALTMAPILGAYGQDYESVHFKRSLEARRAKALYELVLALKETEEQQEEFTKKEASKARGRAQLAQILGGL